MDGGEADGLDQLLRCAIGGDEQAYAAFLRRAAGLVHGMVRRRTAGSGIDPEDVVQETLLAIHLKRHTWRDGAPAAPWLLAIARHKLADAYRRRGRRAEIDIDAVDGLAAAPEPDTATARDVARALAALAPGQRSVVAAVSVRGHSIREAAASLGMTETAVRVALHRGLAAIARQFGRG